MNNVSCPHCGVTVSPDSAFCGACGTKLAAQPSDVAAAGSSSPGWQQPAASSAPPPDPNQPPPTSYPLPGFSPPPNTYTPPAGAYAPPAGAYPPLVPGVKLIGQNTKWAIGLGIVALFCCGPLTGVPGLFLAKKEMDEIAAGRAPFLDEGWAKGAYYLNIVALVLFVLGLCVFWGVGGQHHF